MRPMLSRPRSAAVDTALVREEWIGFTPLGAQLGAAA